MKIHELILGAKNFYHFEITRVDNIRGPGKPFLKTEIEAFQEKLYNKGIKNYTILHVVQMLFQFCSEYTGLIAIDNDDYIVDEQPLLIS